MKKPRNKPIFLIDMDSITVDMTPVWLKEYYNRTGDRLKAQSQDNWAFGKLVKYPEKLNAIIEEDGFFADLPAMPGATEYIPKLIEKGVDLLFVTQLPRKSDFAARDKRTWIEKNIPSFNLRNIIFAHRKYIVAGDLLFDDNPIHLETWKKYNSVYRADATTATIKYLYNTQANANWVFKTKCNAWKQFYEKSVYYYDLK